MNEAAEEVAPPEVHYYSDIGEVPWDIQNYWYQRHRIFSKYEEGIWLTDEAWFGVTPEPIANKIAEHIASSVPENKVVLIDAFAGAGGNSIAFAKSGRWKRVYAIEKDPAVLACAKHNAKIYGVQSKITWFEGDCFAILKKQLKDLGPYSVIFASPPWGVLYLPRTSDLKQLARLVDNGEKIHVKHYCMEGSSKALCAYYGDFKTSTWD
ncbi:hypothetical protein UA08_08989 [Talaromyces atroroseus]|uniref:Trimethylguanosine synthase n=1 Tax=Talaromyces atroroseus TaxID=1441469 RepID=A0A1Q5Q7F4_TALAT|nr:hypothetical protein UA08_08989 [Talaromyces atroroseus]OKL55772.1 hypothetical protein UA08_08989 [Talaromyces atroroseus]